MAKTVAVTLGVALMILAAIRLFWFVDRWRLIPKMSEGCQLITLPPNDNGMDALGQDRPGQTIVITMCPGGGGGSKP